MKEAGNKHPLALAWWEWAGLGAALAFCWAYSLWSFGRCDYASPQEFLKLAPHIEAILKAQAARQGGFPPDTMGGNRPDGWQDDQLAWCRDWRIDYEVHPNGAGGYFVALEFLGCLRTPQYLALGLDPDQRRRYGRGQKIPGTSNRLWVVAESAAITGMTARPKP